MISGTLAGRLLRICWILMAVFHILLLFKVLPSDIAWGGQMTESSNNMIVFEVIALVITAIFIIIISVKMNFIKVKKSSKVINIGIWIIFAYLVLNTAGNLASGVAVENLIFAPITIIMSVLALRLAIEK